MSGELSIVYYYKDVRIENLTNFLEALYEEDCSIKGKIIQYDPLKEIRIYPDNTWKTNFPNMKQEIASLLMERHGSINVGIRFPVGTGKMFSVSSRAKKDTQEISIRGDWYANIFHSIDTERLNEDRTIQLMKSLYYKTKPSYAYLDQEEVAGWKNHVEFDKCKFERFNYINFFSKGFVDCFGRDELLNARLYKVEELEDNGIMTVTVPLGDTRPKLTVQGDLDYLVKDYIMEK
jgi:hypothetical protein